MKIRSLSASKIKTYHMCEFKYLIEYHLGLDTGKTFAAEQGSLVHYILEQFAKAKMTGKDDKGRSLEWLEKNWKEMLFEGYPEYSGEIADGYRGDNPIWMMHKDAPWREKTCDTCPFFTEGKCGITDKPIEDFDGCPKDEYEEAIWLTELILNDESWKNPLNQKIISAEDKFSIVVHEDEDEKIVVNGLADVITEFDEDTVEVWDYKTGKYTQSYKQCEQDYQLKIYHLAAKDRYPDKNIVMTIYYLRRKAGPITLAFDDSEIEQTKDEIRAIWRKIKNNRTPSRICDQPDGTVKPSFICEKMCNFALCQKVHKKFMDQGGMTSQ